MENVKSFNDFLGEGRGNLSMYKSVVQDALHLLGYDLKQSEFKVSIKRESLYDLILLNGYSLCSSSDYAQMLTWIQNAIKEDPAAYGLDPKVLEESTNEETVDEGNVTQFTKPGNDGDIYFSKREGNAIAVKKGDKLQSIYVYDGEVKLGKIHKTDNRWDNMGAPSEKLLIDLNLKNVGGLNTRETQTEDGKLMYKFLSESVNEAMVQVAGKGKPAGANVLAKVILDFLKDGGHLTPHAEKRSALVKDIAQLIMDSTF